MSLAFEIPGETPVERAKEALRRTANYVAFRADLDALILYETRGTSEETYWRHGWIYTVRVALDIPEADLAAALDVHHDSIANACHHIEDVCTDDAAGAFWEGVGKHVVECWANDRAVRHVIDLARARLKRERKFYRNYEEPNDKWSERD